MNQMMADIGDVITSHHASVADLLECGERILVSAFGQLMNDGCSFEEASAYATFRTTQLSKAIIARIARGKQVSN